MSGGTLTAWSVSPALPSGLTLDAKSGVITGVASAMAAAAQGTQAVPAQFAIYQVGSGGATAAASLAFGADDYPEVFASGTVLGALLNYGSDPQLTVFDLSGAAPVATTFTTLPYGPAEVFAAQSPTEWLTGTLVATVPGDAVGWLSDNQLLVDDFAIPAGGINAVVPGSSTALYDISFNRIVSLTTGNPTWASGNAEAFYDGNQTPGGVTGSQVVFISNNQVLAQPY